MWIKKIITCNNNSLASDQGRAELDMGECLGDHCCTSTQNTFIVNSVTIDEGFQGW